MRQEIKFDIYNLATYFLFFFVKQQFNIVECVLI